MPFKDMYTELVGTFPDLPFDQAKRFINRAQRDCYDSWNWSFLAGNGVLNIPNSVSAGTVTVTHCSNIVTADATAAAAWLAIDPCVPITQRALKLGTDQPYQILAFDGVNTVYLDRQYTGTTPASSAVGTLTVLIQPAPADTIQVGSTIFTFVAGAPVGNQIQIGGTIALTVTNILTKLSPLGGLTGLSMVSTSSATITMTAITSGPTGNSIIFIASNPLSISFTGFSGGAVEGPLISFPYLLYRPYYAAPDDFQRWISIVDTTDSWNLIPGKKKEWLDWIDPQRSSIGGPAQFVSFFKLLRAQTIPAFGALSDPITTTTQNLFELWPAPTAAMSLATYYKKRGADMVNPTDTSPFDDGLLIARALYKAAQFVQANGARFAKTTGDRVNWSEMKRDYLTDYSYELCNAMKRDDNVTLTSMVRRQQWWFPSSSWLQRHLTWGEYSAAYANYYNF